MSNLSFDYLNSAIDAHFANISDEDFLLCLEKANYDLYKNIDHSVVAERFCFVPKVAYSFNEFLITNYTELDSCNDAMSDKYNYSMAA